MNKTFSIQSAIGFGFRALTQNIGLFTLALITFVALGAGFSLLLLAPITPALTQATLTGQQDPQMIAELISQNLQYSWPIYVVILAIGLVLYLTIGLGLIRLALDIYHNRPTGLGRIFSSMYLAPRLFGAMVLIAGGFIALGSVSLLIAQFVDQRAAGLVFLAGTLWLVPSLSMTSYAIVDKQMGPIQALRYSFDITQGNKLKILATLFVLGALSSLAAFFIGILAGLLNIMQFADIIAGVIGKLFVIFQLLALAYVYGKLSSGSFDEPAFGPRPPMI